MSWVRIPLAAPLHISGPSDPILHNANKILRSALIQVRIVLTLTVFASFAAAGSQTASLATGEVLVKIRKETSGKAAADMFSRLGGDRVEALGGTQWRLVHISGDADLTSQIRKFSQQSEVEAAQPNFYYHLLAVPNDPLWPNSGLWGMSKISAPQAWDIFTGSSSVVVADIDTGARYTHEDLAPNMWVNTGEIPGNGFDDDGNGFADDYYGYDFFFNDPDPLDEHGHGTHTAGTIGAAGNNALGVAGVNWNIRVMPIKIYNSTGFGTTSAMLVNAYDYIRMMKLRGVNIRVTNNSYGGCDEACGYDQATKEGIDAMTDAGILSVFAAGNNGWNNDAVSAPVYPAAYTSPGILTVASSTTTDARSSFSNWGLKSIDIAAPGSGILSTGRNSDSSYVLMSGTSMATPHVAGAAALLAAYDPTLSPASLKATLLNTGDPLTLWSSTPIRTNARLNIFAALQNRTTCTFAVNENSIQAVTKGGEYVISVSAPPNCDYSVSSSERWASILSGDTATGNAAIHVWVRVNQRITRTASIHIADKTVNITQSRSGNF